jgi:hypothetical protein
MPALPYPDAASHLADYVARITQLFDDREAGEAHDTARVCANAAASGRSSATSVAAITRPMPPRPSSSPIANRSRGGSNAELASAGSLTASPGNSTSAVVRLQRAT